MQNNTEQSDKIEQFMHRAIAGKLLAFRTLCENHLFATAKNRLNEAEKKQFFQRVNHAAENHPDNPHVQVLQGLIFLFGIGVEKNLSQAIMFFNSAVEWNHTYAMLLLADICDPQEAICHLKQVIALYDPESLIHLLDRDFALNCIQAMTSFAKINALGLEHHPRNLGAAARLYRHAYIVLNKLGFTEQNSEQTKAVGKKLDAVMNYLNKNPL